MADFDYVIVGGGMTAQAAVRGVREVDPAGSVAVLSDEPHRPYQRPPLSKGLWLGKPEDSIWYQPPGGGVFFATARATRLDRAAHQVFDAEGRAYGYERLLLATGAAPRTLGPPHERVIAFRTLDDYRRLRRLAPAGAHVVVVGGGFIGSELAAALTQSGCRVTLLFPEATLCARVFPDELGRAVTALFREKGVTLRPEERVERLAPTEHGVSVWTQRGERLEADAVVLGLGVTPRDELARQAGLRVGDGIEVDATLRTSDRDVWAAGDVASFVSPALEQRVRVEHEDAAVTMGEAAGRAMAGAGTAYVHLPFFYSDLFEVGYEAVGEVDARLDTFADWRVPQKQGVVYYLRGGRVRGVLLLDTWNQLDAARALIAEPGRFDAGALRGRLG